MPSSDEEEGGRDEKVDTPSNEVEEKDEVRWPLCLLQSVIVDM
jgi:hypothetical protein